MLSACVMSDIYEPEQEQRLYRIQFRNTDRDAVRSKSSDRRIVVDLDDLDLAQINLKSFKEQMAPPQSPVSSLNHAQNVVSRQESQATSQFGVHPVDSHCSRKLTVEEFGGKDSILNFDTFDCLEQGEESKEPTTTDYSRSYGVTNVTQVGLACGMSVESREITDEPTALKDVDGFIMI